jgi:hypothetical protein
LLKDFNNVLQQKETDLARVQREIKALKLVISLLEEQPMPQAQDDASPAPQSTGTEGPIFSSLSRSESSFWKRKK